MLSTFLVLSGFSYALICDAAGRNKLRLWPAAPLLHVAVGLVLLCS